MIRRRDFLGGILGIGVAPMEALANLITAEDVYSLPEPITAEDVYRPPAPEPKASAAMPQRVQVLVYSTERCEPCARMKREVGEPPTMNGQAFEFVFLNEKRPRPAWVVARLGKGDSYPLMDYVAKTGDWMYQTGWTDFSKFYDKWNKGKLQPAKVDYEAPGVGKPMKSYGLPQYDISKPTPAKHQTQPRHGLYHGQIGSSWSWPGDLRQHLMDWPHSYGSEVLAMTDSQCVALHDQWHNSHRRMSRRA